MDDAYEQSAQYTNDIMEDVDTVIRLKEQLGHNPDDRESLNRKLRVGQILAASDKAERQSEWEAHHYAGSTNVVAKECAGNVSSSA